MLILDELDARGLLADVTDRDGLAALLASQSVPVYAGYDPTSPSLHIGNLVPTILLRRFQLAGHRPIVLVGGSDQYGNITAGCELQHKLRGPRLFGPVAPLLLDPSGVKMGKTSTGERIWLDPERTSPSAFSRY